METDATELSKRTKSNSLKTIITWVIVIVVGVWLFGKFQGAMRPKSWTLFIYNSASPDINEQKARIDTYNNQTTCIEKGLSYTSKGGSFECGYDCRFRDEYLTEICDKVCGRNGCRD